MWIFGKKLNQQPTRSDIPPEFRSFYKRSLIRKITTQRLIAAIILILIIAIVVFGSLWWHSSSSNHAKTAKSQTSQTAKNNQKTQPIPPVSKQTSTTPSTQSSSSISATPSNMPNTGPGNEVFWVALGAGITGTICYYIRQSRNLTSTTPKSEKKF